MPQKILVVDDTPQNVKLLGDLLMAKGYEVTTAVNGELALESIATHPPDLVLLDVMMPGLNGYEVCRKIRENPATALLPVVMCTSLDPHQERIKGIEAGADNFLSKPVNQPELFARVKSLLRLKGLQDERLARPAPASRRAMPLSVRSASKAAGITPPSATSPTSRRAFAPKRRAARSSLIARPWRSSTAASTSSPLASSPSRASPNPCQASP